MARPNPKFKLDQQVRDTFTGKTGKIVAMNWGKGDKLNPPQWYYSFYGWLYYPENDLEAIQ